MERGRSVVVMKVHPYRCLPDLVAFEQCHAKFAQVDHCEIRRSHYCRDGVKFILRRRGRHRNVERYPASAVGHEVDVAFRAVRRNRFDCDAGLGEGAADPVAGFVRA